MKKSTRRADAQGTGGDAGGAGVTAQGAADDAAMAPDTKRLAGLVFELASQLHAERTQRIALELVLERAGMLGPEHPAKLAEDPELKLRASRELARSMNKLMRVLTESDDERAPLRAASAHSGRSSDGG